MKIEFSLADNTKGEVTTHNGQRQETFLDGVNWDVHVL